MHVASTKHTNVYKQCEKVVGSIIVFFGYGLCDSYVVEREDAQKKEHTYTHWCTSAHTLATMDRVTAATPGYDAPTVCAPTVA